jgi:hypothetical protein
MSNLFMNVHAFDGKLKGLFTSSRVHTKDEKKENFSSLIKILTNPSAIIALQTMINDLDQAQGSNFHPENDVDASDILMEILQWINNPDILKSLDEQLADTRNLGICASGRVTRLLQVWSAYKPI